MNSLRRDLFERRLWPIAVILVAAIVAVPFLIGGHGRTTSATIVDAPAPAVGAVTAPKSAPSKSATGHATRSGHRSSAAPGRRDPFVAGASATTSTTATTGTTSVTPNTPSEGSSSGSSDTGSASAPTPAASSGSPSEPTATTPAPTPTPTTTATISRSGVTVSVTQPSGKVTVQATVYGVDVRLTTPSGKASLVDLARYTPLPAASFPKVMFMGATNHGHDAVFALGTGVSASGPARCRPAPDECSLIVLPAGRREHLSYYIDYSKARSMELEVPSISVQEIHSESQLAAADDRYSRIGACELELGDPLLEQSYNAAGALSLGSSCTRKMKVHPFPGPTSGGGL